MTGDTIPDCRMVELRTILWLFVSDVTLHTERGRRSHTAPALGPHPW